MDTTTPPVPLVVETTADLAERWRISERQVRNLMAQGLPSHSIGRNRRFIAHEVDAWLLTREEAA